MVLDLKSIIPAYKDWPRPGINFLDVSVLLQDPHALDQITKWLIAVALQHQATSIVAVESRGFLFASPAALNSRLPLIMARKPGKLPGECVAVTYDTEYSQDQIEMQKHVNVGSRPLIVDDVLATGGTASAVARLLKDHWDLDAIAVAAVIGLDFLPGQKKLTDQGIECYHHIIYE